ncbi:MAG: hypothetical protein JXR63_13750 [Spirochaetales bacterium]|nr:hypothetical protein [Spirochaetales bacterium]
MKKVFKITLLMVLVGFVFSCDEGFTFNKKQVPTVDQLAGFSEGTVELDTAAVPEVEGEKEAFYMNLALVPVGAVGRLFDDILGGKRSISAGVNTFVNVENEKIGGDDNYVMINALKLELVSDANIQNISLVDLEKFKVTNGNGKINLKFLVDLDFSDYTFEGKGESITIKDGKALGLVNISLGVDSVNFDLENTVELINKFENESEPATLGALVKSILELNTGSITGIKANLEMKYAFTVEIKKDEAEKAFGYKVIADVNVQEINIPEIVKISDSDIYNAIFKEDGEFVDAIKNTDRRDPAPLFKYISEDIIGAKVFMNKEAEWLTFSLNFYSGSNASIYSKKYSGIDEVFTAFDSVLAD